MTYEFAKYPDGTVGVFSNIGKKENGEEYIRITFERPKEYGFDTYVIELPSYEVVLEDGHYTEEEKKTFKEIVKNGSSFFFKYARLGGFHYITFKLLKNGKLFIQAILDFTAKIVKPLYSSNLGYDLLINVKNKTKVIY